MDIGLAVYLIVALVTVELTLIYARIKFRKPCSGREDLISMGCFIALLWPAMFIVLIVWQCLALIYILLGYLWRIEL